MRGAIRQGVLQLNGCSAFYSHVSHCNHFVKMLRWLLTKRDDVGHDALQLESPEGAAHAPKAALHLVRHAHRACCAHLRQRQGP